MYDLALVDAHRDVVPPVRLRLMKSPPTGRYMDVPRTPSVELEEQDKVNHSHYNGLSTPGATNLARRPHLLLDPIAKVGLGGIYVLIEVCDFWYIVAHSCQGGKAYQLDAG